MKTATRLLLLIIDSDSARAELVSTSLRANGLAVHMDRYDSAGQIPEPCAQYDLCLISLEHRESLKDVGIKLLREFRQDCPILALGQPACDCSLGAVLAHGFADWVDVDDLLHLREVAKREGDRLSSSRHTALLRDALLDSERRAEQVMQSTREPHAVIIDGAHASANRSYLKLLGLANAEEAIGTPFLDLVDTADRDKAKALLRDYARAESTTRQARLSLRRPDQLILDATLTLSPYIGDGERGLLLTVRSLAQLPPATRAEAPRALPDNQRSKRQQEKMGASIDKAMRQNALKLLFLPLNNTTDDSDRQVQVQLSPRNVKQGLPNGMKLVRLAAEAKTNQSLDRWLLFSAAREAQRLELDNTNLHIPVSLRAIADNTLPEWTRQLMGQISSSEVKLTLSLHIDDCREHMEACEQFASSMRTLGCGISVCDAFKASDDLSIIKALKPDYVQLHQGVMKSFSKNKFSAKNLQRLTSLVSSTGARVICPDLEQEIEPRKLAALGIHLGKTLEAVAKTPSF